MSTRSRRSLAVVALAVVAGAAWLGARAYTTASSLSNARSALDSARTHLLARDLTRARTDLARAARDTASARSGTRSWAWRAAADLPFVGRSLRCVSVVAAAADSITHQTLPTALKAAENLDPARLRGPDGSIDVAYLRQARPIVDDALRSSAAAHAEAAGSPSSLLLPYVGAARAQFLTSSEHLTAALLATRRALDLAPALLGADRPRRYFVAVQQNAESRGTGGLIGGFAVIEARSGRFRVLQQGSDRDLYADDRGVDPPAGLPSGFTKAYGFYSVFGSWQSINIPPQLPAVSRLIAAKWQARSGQRIDGVVMLDGNALREILLGTDPIRVAGGATIQPTDIADYLAIGQYQNVSLSETARAQRKDSLEAVARTVLDRLTATGKDSGLLLQGLVRAVRSGHLRMASDDPALSGLHTAGIDGASPEGTAPVAYPVVFNAQGSKLDLWLHRSVRWSCGSHGRATITVELRDELPKGTLPPYVGLDLRQNPKVVVTRTDAVHLDVFVTKGARLVSVTLDGKPLAQPTSGVVGGLPYWGTDLDLPESVTRTFKVVVDGAGKGRVRMPEQPLAVPLVKEGSEGC